MLGADQRIKNRNKVKEENGNWEPYKVHEGRKKKVKKFMIRGIENVKQRVKQFFPPSSLFLNGKVSSEKSFWSAV